MSDRQRSIDTLRVLAAEAVQLANSGHPGAPMGMAEMAAALWQHHLVHNPLNPLWPNRDRFVLSNGHASMLLYVLLHLTGYDLTIEDIQQFRQLKSKTPGHPELGITAGVETSTGPLGQGLANAVGMAITERILGDTFNRENFPIVDYHTYVFLGDGCLMEGISHEVCSLAGTLGLGKLICLYDDNQISIDGKTEGWFNEKVPERFRAYHWHVIENVDGHDVDAISNAIAQAKAETSRPTLICCKTTIGKGAPTKAGTSAVHGAPLGEAEISALKEQLGWSGAAFSIPESIYDIWRAQKQGQAVETEWQQLFEDYAKTYPELAKEFRRRLANELPEGWQQTIDGAVRAITDRAEAVATRKASQQSLQILGPLLPELLGGSADLTESNLTAWSGSIPVTATQSGNYIHYGVREFGMAAIQNGLALHGNFIPYGGTFLTFSDYAKNAIRMAALMGLRSIYVFTHDSIGLGEDGPTHQPIEQAATLRYIPNLDVWRPCDTLETFCAWVGAIERLDGPSALLLSRQNLPFVTQNQISREMILKGGYVLSPEAADPLDMVLLATGSEVSLALDAQKHLATKGINARVVSMPCTNRFDRQSKDYQRQILPQEVPTIAIEAGTPDFWYKYVGFQGVIIGISSFGESAPATQLFEHFGLTVENIVRTAQRLLK